MGRDVTTQQIEANFALKRGNETKFSNEALRHVLHLMIAMQEKGIEERERKAKGGPRAKP